MQKAVGIGMPIIKFPHRHHHRHRLIAIDKGEKERLRRLDAESSAYYVVELSDGQVGRNQKHLLVSRKFRKAISWLLGKLDRDAVRMLLPHEKAGSPLLFAKFVCQAPEGGAGNVVDELFSPNSLVSISRVYR